MRAAALPGRENLPQVCRQGSSLLLADPSRMAAHDRDSPSTKLGRQVPEHYQVGIIRRKEQGDRMGIYFDDGNSEVSGFPKFGCAPPAEFETDTLGPLQLLRTFTLCDRKGDADLPLPLGLHRRDRFPSDPQAASAQSHCEDSEEHSRVEAKPSHED